MFYLQCYNFEWPSLEEARQSFDAIFITGSVSSVNDSNKKWIAEICALLELYVQEHIKVVGICFGAQVQANTPMLSQQ